MSRTPSNRYPRLAKMKGQILPLEYELEYDEGGSCYRIPDRPLGPSEPS
jgi:hypothetical protein